jgi:hypothetical protein
MDPFDPSAVVAERRLRAAPDLNVTVRVFKPIPDQEHEVCGGAVDWVCGFEIVGLEGDIRDRVFGVDSMQALSLAFPAIRRCLRASKPELSSLEAGVDGFERYNPDPLMDEMIELLIEVEVHRMNRVFEELSPDSLGSANSSQQLVDSVGKLEEIRQRILHRTFARALSKGNRGGAP